MALHGVMSKSLSPLFGSIIMITTTDSNQVKCRWIWPESEYLRMDPFDDDWDFLMEYFTRDCYAVATELHPKPAPGHADCSARGFAYIGMLGLGYQGHLICHLSSIWYLANICLSSNDCDGSREHKAASISGTATVDTEPDWEHLRSVGLVKKCLPACEKTTCERFYFTPKIKSMVWENAWVFGLPALKLVSQQTPQSVMSRTWNLGTPACM